MNPRKENAEQRVYRMIREAEKRRAKLAVDLKYGKIDRLEARALNLVLTAEINVLTQIEEVL